MLVLTRKRQQRILIGDGVTVTVLEIRGNIVKLGIEAPGDVNIRREELSAQPVSTTDTNSSVSDVAPKG